MESHTQIGKQFQERCRQAFERTFARTFDLDVGIQIAALKPHVFDLATPQRDIVAECKAFTWTIAGNIPSAKITTLRETVQYLRELSESIHRYLVIKHHRHPKRKETLAEYFVRLNKERLGPVNVLELPEEGGEFSCLYGSLRAGRSTPPPRESRAGGPPERVTAEGVRSYRRRLLQILDRLEKKPSSGEAPSKRISRLRSPGPIPSSVASLMHTILAFRNIAEYEDEHYLATGPEAAAIKNAWRAIIEWARANGVFDNGEDE